MTSFPNYPDHKQILSISPIHTQRAIDSFSTKFSYEFCGCGLYLRAAYRQRQLIMEKVKYSLMSSTTRFTNLSYPSITSVGILNVPLQ